MSRKPSAETELKNLRREIKRRAESERSTGMTWRRCVLELRKAEKHIVELKADVEGWKGRFDALLRRDQV